MDSIDIKEVLTRNGWVAEQTRENLELREQVERLQEELAIRESHLVEVQEQLEKQYQLEVEQHDLLKQKFTLIEQQLQRREKQHERMMQNVLHSQQETEVLKKEWEEYAKKNKHLQKKLHKMRKEALTPPSPSQPNKKEVIKKKMVTDEKSSVSNSKKLSQDQTMSTKQSQRSMLEKHKFSEPPSKFPIASWRADQESGGPLTYLPSPPKDSKPRKVYRLRSGLLSKSPIVSQCTGRERGSSTYLPSPPQDSKPGKVYRRRHGISTTETSTNSPRTACHTLCRQESKRISATTIHGHASTSFKSLQSQQ